MKPDGTAVTPLDRQVRPCGSGSGELLVDGWEFDRAVSKDEGGVSGCGTFFQGEKFQNPAPRELPSN